MRPPRRTPFVLALAMSCAGLGHAAPPAPDTTPRAAIPDLDVVGATRLVRGSAATFEVRAHLAQTWRQRLALEPAESPVTARLMPHLTASGAASTRPRDLTVTRDGAALTLIIPPDLPLGKATLQLKVATAEGPATARLRVDVVDAHRLLLKTDSAIVQPGGRLAWRVALLNTFTRRPLAPTDVTAVLLDSTSTPRASWTTSTDRFGLASGHLTIPASLRPGRYRLQVTSQAGDLVETQALEVRPFEPQAFFVSVSETTDPERRVARFEITARHADGAPMNEADIAVSDERGDTLATGRTDGDGRFYLESAASAVTATVVDKRGERVTARHDRTSAAPLEVQLLTAGSRPTAGEHFTFQVATHRGGVPTQTQVELELRVAGQVVSTQRLTSDPTGLAAATVFLAPRPAIRSRRQAALTLAPLDTPPLREVFARVPALDCLERGTLAVTLTPAPQDDATRTRWAVHAMHLPFPERPDFAVALTPEQLKCLDLLSHLPPRTSASPDLLRAEISIFETIDVDHDGDELELELLATSADGLASTRLELTTSSPREAPLSVSPALATPGERLTVHAANADPEREALAVLLDDGVAIAVAPLVERHASLPVPTTASGLLSVELWSFDRESAGPLIAPLVGQAFARPRPLSVTLEHPATARPGSTVALTVAVTDGDRPVQARLFASVIDERLLALSPEVANAPPLSTWLTQYLTDPLRLDEHATRFAELLRRPDTSPAEDGLLAALLTLVPSARPSTELVLPAPVREHAERSRLEALRSELVDRAVRRADLALATDNPPLADLLTGLPFGDGALDPERPAHLDPWHRPHTWASARLLVPHYDATAFGREVTSLRLDLVMPRLRAKTAPTAGELSALVRAPRHLTHDAWGRPLMVTPLGRDLIVSSAGPDGTHGTDDDLTLSRDETLRRRLLGYGSGGFGYVGDGSGGGGSGAGRIAAMRTTTAEGLAAVRERFDTNVLWESVTTNAAGQHRFEVPLSDSTTTWRIDVEAMTDDGRFGHARTQLNASLPISVDLRLPDALIVGDRFVARALAVNTTASPRELTLEATADGLTLGTLAPDDVHFRLEAGQSRAIAIPLLATRPGRGRVQLTLADSGGVVDSIVKHLDVQDIGMERRLTRRARLDGRSPSTLDTSIPGTTSPPRELTATLTAHRGAPDLALSSLAALLRTPTGCFEQTTAKSWPNLLVLRLLPKDHPLATKARDLAIAGYERLKTFEVRGRGFALYPGESPATILTAIGLVQLVDAANVIDVERPLLDRIAMALIARQSADGRFLIDTGWYGSEDPLAVTAYAAWSLAETLRAHTTRPEAKLISEPTARALDRSLSRARRALSRRSAEPMNPRTAYIEVLSNLAGVPAPSATTHRAPMQPLVAPSTIFSAGPSARVELAALSLLDTTRREASGEGGSRHLDALMAARSSGGWPTTQTTIHALRAIAELDTGAPTGQLDVSAGGGQALEPLSLESASLPSRVLDSHLLSGLSGPLTVSSSSPVMVELDLVWRETAAPTRESRGLTVHVDAPLRPLELGERATLTVGVHNPGDSVVHLPTAILEIPPGFKLDEAALRQLARNGGHLDHVEVFGRRVELYFDALPSGGAALVPLTLTPTHEVQVAMRPAEAFAYYDPELRGQSDPLRLVSVER